MHPPRVGCARVVPSLQIRADHCVWSPWQLFGLEWASARRPSWGSVSGTKGLAVCLAPSRSTTVPERPVVIQGLLALDPRVVSSRGQHVPTYPPQEAFWKSRPAGRSPGLLAL